MSYKEVLKMIAFPHKIRIGLKDKTGNLTDSHDIAQKKGYMVHLRCNSYQRLFQRASGHTDALCTFSIEPPQKMPSRDTKIKGTLTV